MPSRIVTLLKSLYLIATGDRATLVLVILFFATYNLTALSAELDEFCRFEELLVVGDDIYIGAAPEWFPKSETRYVYSQWDGGYRFLLVGDAADQRYISTDKTGRLFITSDRNLLAKRWTYYGPVRVADEDLTFIEHGELSHLWRNKNDPKEKKDVWPVFLRPAKEPTVIRDKDGMERQVFRAVLAKQQFHEQYQFTVSRVRKEAFYPSLRLLNFQYAIRGLCVYRGEVYYGNFGVNQFPTEDFTDYWLPDAPFLVTKWNGKFRLLSVTEEGDVKLTDRATLNTYWVHAPPKSEVSNSSIGFRMQNFKSTRESKETRYLVPDDKPTLVKDKDGKQVELFRLKLGKEPQDFRLSRYAP